MIENQKHAAARAAADAVADEARLPHVDEIARPRLTPQNRADGAASGEDATDPSGRGAKQGQADPAEGTEDDLADALRRPQDADADAMRFGAGSEENAPDGSPDAAIRRAAAGWSGREGET